MKGQSAVEYLTTYGWMVIAVGVLIGVFVGLNQQACIESSTGFQGASVTVGDFGLNTQNGVSMVLENSKPHKITVERVEADTDNGSRTVTLNQDLDPGRPSAINVSGFAHSSSCNTFDIEIYYREGGLDDQSISGTITMNAELDDSPFAIAKADGEESFLTVSPGTNITFNGSESGDPLGQSLTYEWDLKDGTTETDKSFNHSYSSVGTYLVELNVTNQDGISSQDYVEIDVREVRPVAKAHNETGIFKYDYLEAYEGETITFNGSETTDTDGLSIVSYEWDLDNGDVLTGETVQYSSGFGSGEYNITMTAENSAGDTGKDNLIVNVTTSAPAAPSNLQFE